MHNKVGNPQRMTSKNPEEFLELSYLEADANTQEYTKLQNEQLLPFAASGIFNAPLRSATYLTRGPEVKTVIELRVNLEGSDIQYTPGNSFGIIPQNCEKEVAAIIDRLNFNVVADTLYSLSVKETSGKKKNRVPAHVPLIGTIRDTLTHNLDIRSIPKKTFLRALSTYTTDEEELTTLNHLCCPRGSTKYTDFIATNYVTLLALLSKFPSCFPPFTVFLQHLPRLQPRPYSVASSPLPSISTVDANFVFSVTQLPNDHKGVCTCWLQQQADAFLASHPAGENPKIPIYLRRPNSFQFPGQFDTNIIMIAAGTGIAPFMGFLEHRAKSLDLNHNLRLGTAWLFYGCRFEDRDFLYKSKIDQYVNSRILNKLFTCYSRQNSRVKYVQDLVADNAEEFINFMFNENAVVYVCGGTSMSDGVFQSIVGCLKAEKKCSEEEARATMQEWKTTNRYVEDVWI